MSLIASRILLWILTVAALVATDMFCTIRIPMGSRKLDGPPRVMDIVNPMLKLKIIQRDQLMGQQFEVTVEDSAGNPVPFSYFVLGYEDRVDSVQTDSLGVTHLTISEELLEENPTLEGRGNGVKYNATVSFFASLDFDDIGAAREAAQIDPADYEVITAESLAVLYAPMSASDPAGILALLEDQAAYIRSYLALAPIPWGVILVDTSGSIVLTTTHYTSAGVRHHLFPITRDEMPNEIYTGCFRTFAKNSLLAAVPVSEDQALWFFNGLADYWTDVYLDSLESVGALPRTTAESIEEQALEAQALRASVEEPVDLAEWLPSDARDWNTGFELFRAFWHEIADRYGEQCIARMVADLDENLTPSADSITVSLARHAGPEAVPLLRQFRP